LSDNSGIRYELAEAVATITLDRPDRLNAITPALLDELGRALDRAVSDGARAVLLTGEGRAFCAGADLVGPGGEIGLPDDLGALIDAHYNPVAIKLSELPLPIVTAMNGPAVGAGLSLALAGDIVIAARSAYLLLAFVNIGLVPDAGATWLVAKGVGRAKALEMALLGEKMSAQDAMDAGLVTRVVDDEAVLTEARAIALRLATMPTAAIAKIRAQVKAALAGTLEQTLEIERDNQREAGRSADFREGVAAFIEKRKPKFEGR
jgi:2-(1,2-epoxy-1,2-dihydrophenyl)acetyl-CoA isomerase